MDTKTRLRNYVFTSYDLDSTFTKWDCEEDLPDKCRFIVYQHEICPESGREHLQGYVEFRQSMRIRAAKQLLGDPSLHLEVRMGTPDQAIEYCSRDSKRKAETDVVRLGDCAGGQGARSDLAIVCEEIMSGKRLHQVAMKYPIQFVRCHRGMRELAFIYAAEQARADRLPQVHVLYGPTGSGKTRTAVAAGGEDYYILNPPTNQGCWFDGYDGHPLLIIDEFAGWLPQEYLLRLLDRYACTVPIKGSFTWALWTTVYITSNQPPTSWYREGLQDRLLRRFASVTRLGEVEFSLPVYNE